MLNTIKFFYPIKKSFIEEQVVCNTKFAFPLEPKLELNNLIYVRKKMTKLKQFFNSENKFTKSKFIIKVQNFD